MADRVRPYAVRCSISRVSQCCSLFVSVAEGCCNKLLNSWWFKTRALPVLKARARLQGMIDSSRSLPASGGSLSSPGVQQHVLVLVSTWPSSPCLCPLPSCSSLKVEQPRVLVQDGEVGASRAHLVPDTLNLQPFVRRAAAWGWDLGLAHEQALTDLTCSQDEEGQPCAPPCERAVGCSKGSASEGSLLKCDHRLCIWTMWLLCFSPLIYKIEHNNICMIIIYTLHLLRWSHEFSLDALNSVGHIINSTWRLAIVM